MGIGTILRALRSAITGKRAPAHGAFSPRRAMSAGPPAIALGRRYAADKPHIRIEPFETEFRVETGQVLVRAWIALPDEKVAPATLARIDATARRLQHLPPLVRQILFLCISYRLTTAEIAITLGISRRRTKRLLLHGIAALDGAALTRPDREEPAVPNDRG